MNIPQNSKFIHDKLTNQPHLKWRKPEVKQILSTLEETNIEVEQIFLAACSNSARIGMDRLKRHFRQDRKERTKEGREGAREEEKGGRKESGKEGGRLSE